MSFLKQHGRFIAALLVLVVIVGWGFSAVGEMATTVDKKRTALKGAVRSHYDRIFANAKESEGRPANVEALILSERTIKTQELEEKRNALMQFKPDSRFTLAPLEAKAGGAAVSDDDKKDYFTNTMYRDVKAELERARYFKPKFTDSKPLGFSVEPAAIKPELVPSLLLRLDIALEICHCVERSGVQILESLEFNDGFAAIMAARGLPTVEGPAPAPDQPKQPAYLVPNVVTVKLQGNERALYNLLIELQRPVKGELQDRYLAVESFAFSKPDLDEPKNDLVTAEIKVVAYRVNADGFVPGGKKKEADTAGATSGGGRFR